MWRPNKSNSNRADINARTYNMSPYATPFGSSSVVSNDSGGNNKELHDNIRGNFTPYFPGSFESRNSTNIVNYLPSGIQQSQEGLSSMRNRSHVLTNEHSLRQLPLGNSHGHLDITKRPPLFPNKPSLTPNKGHTRQIVDSFGGFVSTDGSGSSSTELVNVPSSATGLNLSDDPNACDDVNAGINDSSHLPVYYSSVGNPQGQSGLKRINNFSFFQHDQYFGIPNEGFSAWSPFQGGLDLGGLIDYSKTQRQKEHVVQPQQFPTGRSPGFMFGSINAYDYSLPQRHDSSINGLGFSFPTSGNRDGSRQYQHFQQPQPQPQPQPRFYNPLRGKEVVQGSLLGPDDYGLLGLLKIVKGANHAKTTLAMGVDPHSLGLDLNSSEPLHPKFASPWSVEPAKEGTKFEIPDCYNSKQPPPLKQSLFKKFDLAVLFYIFYSMPQDEAQVFAANELHDRGWYFHRELRMWFTRDQKSVPAVRNATFEVGSYVFFDPSTWQTIRQEKVVLYYEMIEQRPAVPP